MAMTAAIAGTRPLCAAGSDSDFVLVPVHERSPGDMIVTLFDARDASGLAASVFSSGFGASTLDGSTLGSTFASSLGSSLGSILGSTLASTLASTLGGSACGEV